MREALKTTKTWKHVQAQQPALLIDIRTQAEHLAGAAAVDLDDVGETLLQAHARRPRAEIGKALAAHRARTRHAKHLSPAWAGALWYGECNFIGHTERSTIMILTPDGVAIYAPDNGVIRSCDGLDALTEQEVTAWLADHPQRPGGYYGLNVSATPDTA